jgi:hypothetical protein
MPHTGPGSRVVVSWSCLLTASGTPPLGYLAGRVVTPASPDRPPREGEAGHRSRLCAFEQYLFPHGGDVDDGVAQPARGVRQNKDCVEPI